jgi:general secretion pathway protein H
VHPKGFTLIELIIVLVVLAVASGLVGILVNRGSGTFELKSLSKHMATTLRYARSRAIAEKKAYLFIVPEDLGYYGLYTDFPRDEDLEEANPVSSHPIPEEITVTFREQEGAGIIEFYPRGTSSGGIIEITSQKGKQYFIHVNRITGRVKVHEDEIS